MCDIRRGRNAGPTTVILKQDAPNVFMFINILLVDCVHCVCVRFVGGDGGERENDMPS